MENLRRLGAEAGILAGLATGRWQTLDEIARLPRPHALFEPRISAQERGELYAGWQSALARATLAGTQAHAERQSALPHKE